MYSVYRGVCGGVVEFFEMCSQKTQKLSDVHDKHLMKSGVEMNLKFPNIAIIV
jgi:hypothetical protein